MKIKNKLFTSTLLLPWIITFCVFWLYPLIYAGYLSLTDYTTLTNSTTFVGLKNYANLLHDSIFYKALANTAIFTIGTVPVTTAIAMFLAVLLNSKLARFKQFFRTSLFIPSVTSLVVISLIFTNLYTQNGYITYILQTVGLPYPKLGFLQDTVTALPAIMVMDIWSAVGYYMILLLAGMQAIPTDLYSFADLSGASAWQKFRMITLPKLKPTIIFIVFINTVKSFQIFIEVMIMTQGGPMNATTTLVYNVYTNAFEKADTMGYAATMAFVIFFILLAFTGIQQYCLKYEKD